MKGVTSPGSNAGVKALVAYKVMSAVSCRDEVHLVLHAAVKIDTKNKNG